ncbi:MAG: tRNA pseudouridine(38-40) synthase TruA [Flavobacteriaceae bacterium]|nr:tRNA pseudouridine(38-40) synthase TruA [Flavobacteriaceae bacterium]
MRYFIELQYNGGNYHGWQQQLNAVTIQEKLNNALSVLLKEAVNVMGAGRTDTGVHAEQFFAHFDIENEIEEELLIYKLNSILPTDIVVKNIFKVQDEAHARFDAISRSYEYRIWLGKNPFLRDLTWQTHLKPSVEKMNEAANLLLRYQDFKCFSKSKTDVNTYNCSISEAVWKQEGNMLIFYITADRFLRNMARAIVGTLIEIGLGKISIDDFKRIIESRNRSEAGVSVPPQGLFLTKIVYPKYIII